MTIIPDRLDLLDGLALDSGGHSAPDDLDIAPAEACVMEAVAWVAGEPWSDHPKCASKVLGAFLRSWNDCLDDEGRQSLKPYVARLVGSAGTPEQEDARAWMALDWLVRSYTPAWLRLAGLTGHAATLAGLPEFMAGMDVPSVRPAIDAARTDADAAGDAAWDAAGAAAWDAAGAAAGAAAWDAAGAAARDAARDAARAAAWAAAGAAAWDAARDALAPTVTEVQGSAHGLVERMLAVTEASS